MIKWTIELRTYRYYRKTKITEKVAQGGDWWFVYAQFVGVSFRFLSEIYQVIQIHVAPEGVEESKATK